MEAERERHYVTTGNSLHTCLTHPQYTHMTYLTKFKMHYKITHLYKVDNGCILKYINTMLIHTRENRQLELRLSNVSEGAQIKNDSRSLPKHDEEKARYISIYSSYRPLYHQKRGSFIVHRHLSHKSNCSMRALKNYLTHKQIVFALGRSCPQTSRQNPRKIFALMTSESARRSLDVSTNTYTTHM